MTTVYAISLSSLAFTKRNMCATVWWVNSIHPASEIMNPDYKQAWRRYPWFHFAAVNNSGLYNIMLESVVFQPWFTKTYTCWVYWRLLKYNKQTRIIHSGVVNLWISASSLLVSRIHKFTRRVNRIHPPHTHRAQVVAVTSRKAAAYTSLRVDGLRPDMWWLWII